MTKGAIVTGLGVALLLGGGGTLATWNMDQSASAGTITTGNMNLAAEPGAWTSNLKSGTVATGETIKGYQIVPEEQMTYTQVINVSAEGNLEAVLSMSTGTLSSELLDNLTLQKFTVTKQGVGGGTTVMDRYDQSVTVAPGKYTVSATVRFDANGKDAMNASLDLSNIKYVLTQKNPTPVN
ncbi:alternate-type signal peptide domain-containing protein [Citricoccus parietis]